MALILASSSPRRRELLSLLGLPFEVRAAGIDETPRAGELPDDYVRRMAREKAEVIANNLRTNNSIPSGDSAGNSEGLLVIGADTEVVIDGAILGKPRDAGAAAAMLKRLRGRTHQVISAVTVVEAHTGRRQEETCRSEAPMRNYTDAEIEAYAASGDPLDKAGGYAIQHEGFHPVEDFQHCFASVMGLPLCHLVRALRRFGVTPAGDVPAACQRVNRYLCPVYGGILTDPGHE